MKLAPPAGLRRRLALLGLAVVLLVLAWDVYSLECNAVAWTWSLGGGWGFTRRTARYHALPPVLRASADAHEAHHLERGTWRVWRVRRDEVDAYRAQLMWLERQRGMTGARDILLAVEAAGVVRAIEALK